MLAFLATSGGPVSNSTIDKGVAEALGIPEKLLQEIHSGTRTEFQYRMAWARTKAKAEGKISSPQRQQWMLRIN
jgi:restriction endonuclease Mrr